SMGVPQEDARYYQSEYEAGRSIVAVLADGRMQEATAIMTRYGGYGANRRFAQTNDYSSGATADTAQTETEGAQRVQLREEQLEAGKQTVQTGEVGLRKEVVTEQKTMDVPVSREEVVIERRPGSGQPSDRPIGEGETYRVPVREEQVTVEKQPVVREEIGLGKRPVQETKRVSDTVRREEAHVEREGDVDIKESNVEDREG